VLICVYGGLPARPCASLAANRPLAGRERPLDLAVGSLRNPDLAVIAPVVARRAERGPHARGTPPACACHACSGGAEDEPLRRPPPRHCRCRRRWGSPRPRLPPPQWRAPPPTRRRTVAWPCRRRRGAHPHRWWAAACRTTSDVAPPPIAARRPCHAAAPHHTMLSLQDCARCRRPMRRRVVGRLPPPPRVPPPPAFLGRWGGARRGRVAVGVPTRFVGVPHSWGASCEPLAATGRRRGSRQRRRGVRHLATNNAIRLWFSCWAPLWKLTLHVVVPTATQSLPRSRALCTAHTVWHGAPWSRSSTNTPGLIVINSMQ